MQAHFEPEQAFSISMLQAVFEISIAFKKNMYLTKKNISGKLSGNF